MTRLYDFEFAGLVKGANILIMKRQRKSVKSNFEFFEDYIYSTLKMLIY